MRRKVANARIDMRITPEKKYFLELAAFISGYESLSNFIVKSSETIAKRILDNPDNFRQLSLTDRDLLLQFLDKAPEPNEALKKAFENIVKTYQIDKSGQTIYKIDPNLIKSSQKKLL